MNQSCKSLGCNLHRNPRSTPSHQPDDAELGQLHPHTAVPVEVRVSKCVEASTCRFQDFIITHTRINMNNVCNLSDGTDSTSDIRSMRTCYESGLIGE